MAVIQVEFTVKAVDDDLANYRIPEAARALQEFVDDMRTGMSEEAVSVSGQKAWSRIRSMLI